MSQMCLEIFRACFMGFLDTSEYTENLQWATFLLLKLPHILATMRQQMPDWDVAAHVEKGIDMLMEYTHLLDQADIKLESVFLMLLFLVFIVIVGYYVLIVSRCIRFLLFRKLK